MSETTLNVVIAPSYKISYTKESTNLGITRLQAYVSAHYPVPPLPWDKNVPLIFPLHVDSVGRMDYTTLHGFI